MGPLLSAFIAAAFAEFGDKTQLLGIALAVAYARTAQILVGLFAAVLASSLIAAAAGAMVHDMIPLRAASLLVGIALLFAGGAGLMKPGKTKPFAKGRTPALIAAFVCVLAAEMGDKSQFITFGLAAQFNSFLLAALGATGGILVATVPAVLLAAEFRERVPVRAIRTVGAALFLVAGAFVAVSALRLV